MKGTRTALKTFESTDTMRYVHSKRLCDMNAVLLYVAAGRKITGH